MPKTNTTAGHARVWTAPTLNRLGAMRDVADNRGGNGNGRWSGNCKGKPCWPS